LLLAWWARIHLGCLWSDWAMAKKAGHHIVDAGPYRSGAPSNLFGAHLRGVRVRN
jgi:hypothetical protein